jgi:hypothetical protein
MFSVNLLVYGNYPELAARCLGSIVKTADPTLVAEVRVGMNEVCDATRDLVTAAMDSSPVPFYVYEEKKSGANVLKYPMMRRMLYDPQHPLPYQWQPRVMWFDDDSYVKGGKEFWRKAADAFEAAGSPLMGSCYHACYHWTDAETRAFYGQPWYGRQPVSPMPMFVTGGWWVADLEFLSKWDYPFRELRHNCGDIILGEVMRQQGLKPHHYRDGVAINADANGVESAAKRRGVTTRRPFEKPPPYDYSHHDFEVTVTCNSKKSSGST